MKADYLAHGLDWALDCPLGKVTGVGTCTAAPTVPTEPESRMWRILVVDDDPMLALSIVDMLEDAGFGVIGPAHSVESALALIAQSRPDFAILDIDLGHTTSEPIVVALRRLDVPFICVSGHSTEQISSAFPDSPLPMKPVGEAVLLEAVRRYLGIAKNEGEQPGRA